MKTKLDFETSRIISKKGYSEDVYNHIHNEIEWDLFKDNIQEIYFPFPTIHEAVMWLYTKKNIWISVAQCNDGKGFYFGIVQTGGVSSDIFETPEMAYNEGIKYTLNNLL